MQADSYGEIFLGNRDVDRLIRVLQRMESVGILSKHEMKVYESVWKRHVPRGTPTLQKRWQPANDRIKVAGGDNGLSGKKETRNAIKRLRRTKRPK